MSALADLPPLREVIARHGLLAKKALGQNFLLDINLTRRIARASGSLEGATVVEIGPGPGGLTRALLLEGAARVVAVERDRRCLPALAEIADVCEGRLAVIEGDALAVDLGDAIGPGPARIVANLPYNVATPLLISWLTLDRWPPWWTSLTLMFQREVAERIVAAPGSDAYGRLGVMAGWRTEAKIAFDVAPQAFVPAPKVVSTVVHLTPRVAPFPCPVKALERVTAAAFGQRRKMIRQSLKGLGRDPGPLIEAAGLDPTARAEELSVADFARLAALVG